MKLRTLLPAFALLVATSGLAHAERGDLASVVALDIAGAHFGWSFHLTPPDPCSPPDPCKIRLVGAINVDARPELDQGVVIFHHDEGGTINPCIRVLHSFRADGSMAEEVSILDAEDAVHITVPPGLALRPDENGGYTVVRTDLPPGVPVN